MVGALMDIGAVFGRWRTWFLMASQDIRMRYRRSLIGPFWLSISMAMTVVGMALVFGNVFERSFQEYLVFLSAGFLIWGFIALMINEGCTILVEAENHLRAVPLPVSVLAARMVQRNVVIFLHNAIVIAALVAIFGFTPTINLLFVIPGVVLLTAFGFFLALVLGPICLRFRDVTQVVGSLLQLAFFLTPIIWMPDQGRVPEAFVTFNLFYHMIELVRAPIQGAAPTALNWLVVGGGLWVLMALSVVTLAAARKRIYTWL
jgi:lipopolysaccharide transport system permease protein